MPDNYGETATLEIRKDERTFELTFDDIDANDVRVAAIVLEKAQEITGIRVWNHNGRIIYGSGELR